MNKYDDLIVVGYPAGWGGEMFCSLLHNNYYSNTQYLNRQPLGDQTIVNMIKYSGAKRLEYLKSFRQLFCTCDSDLNNEKFDGAHAFIAKHAKDMQMGLYNMVCDGTPEGTIENTIDLARLLYSIDPPKIWPCHYSRSAPGAFKSFTMDAMFPGSKKIRLISDEYHTVLFMGLFFYKLNSNYCYGSEPVNSKYENIHCLHEEAITSKIFMKGFDKKLEDFVDIDVGRLYFDNCSNVDEIEGQLSNHLGKSIIIDKKYLTETYNPKNNLILEHVFGKYYLNNNTETNMRKLIDYGRERAKTNF